MESINANNLSIVLDALRQERAELLRFLQDLTSDEWDSPTECPAYSVKGIASHILGDDLSLLSRQRDGATQGLILVAEKMPGVDFRTLLDTFNDQWVEASRFMSVPLLIEMLRLSGEWSLDYYSDVDPMLPGEPVPLFLPAPGEPSPFWQAIVREYLERWAHHSQMRRAVGRPSLADAPFLEVGVRIVAAAAGVPATVTDDRWAVGPLELGSAQQTADILTLTHTEDEVRTLVQGPDELVAQFAGRVARRNDA
jgi:uncharacterized protein (TIGR03083 family)